MISQCLTLKPSASQKDMNTPTSQPLQTVQRIVPGTVEPFCSMKIKPAATYIPWRLLYRRWSPVCYLRFENPKNPQGFAGVYQQNLEFIFHKF